MLAVQKELIVISSVQTLDVVWETIWERRMIGMERKSGKLRLSLQIYFVFPSTLFGVGFTNTYTTDILMLILILGGWGLK